MPYYAVIGLTSETGQGVLHSKMSDVEIGKFFLKNNFKRKDKVLILSAIKEARCNGIGLFIINSEDASDKQIGILRELRGV